MHAETHNFGDSATPIREQGTVEAPIRIANNCWIGSDVVVLGGVEIGEGAVIAAGSVVTKTVDQGAIVAGVPANVMRTRL
jgi:acetyltransferase-like isoleucine patch superfamily enzyme